MQDVVCKNCGSVNDYTIVKKANNNCAYCNGCEKFIKNISYSVPKFYFGKYKGVAVSEVTDISYLNWFLENIETLTENGRKNIKEQIAKLQQKEQKTKPTPNLFS
jgi:hypothetical protein